MCDLSVQLSSSGDTISGVVFRRAGNELEFRWAANSDRFPDDRYTLYVMDDGVTLSDAVSVTPTES